jgi:hypothetical protein
MLLRLKNLLHHEKYTLAGARKKLRPASASQPTNQTLEEIRQELMALRRLLE